MNTPISKVRSLLRFAILPALLLSILASFCFSRLIANPAALIVDGARASVDHANPGQPRPIGNDLTFLFLPHHLFISRSIAETGHWPMWDSTGFGGRPMLGNPQAGMFYPPVWLAWHAGFPAALGWLTVAHLLWGGLGTYLLARLWGSSRFGSTVAAGCFQAAPYLLGHVFEGHYPHVWGVCWFPWAFWAYDNRRLNRRRGIVTLPLIVALVYIVGHPQEGFLLGIALTFRAFVDWTRSKKHEGILVRWIGIMLVASGLAAIDLVPQIALRDWKLSTAAVTDAASEIPGRYSLRLINALQLLSPEALGGPADYDGYDNSWETMLSFGLIPLVLAVAAILLHEDRPAVRSWFILGGLTLWVACGYKLGLYALLYHLVPGTNFFRVPARPLFLTSLAMSLLAGLGVDALKSHLDWRRLGRVLLLGLALTFFSFALVMLLTERHSDRGAAITAGDSSGVSAPAIGSKPSPQRTRGWGREQRAIARVAADARVWSLAATIGAIVGLGAIRTRWHHQRLTACGLGLLAFLELGYWGHSLLQVTSPGEFMGPDPVAEAIQHARPASHRPSPRLKAKDTFYSDLRAISNGFEKTNIDDVFQLQHAAVLYQQLYALTSRPLPWPEAPMDRAVDDHRQVIRQRVLDLMAVGFLVTDHVEAQVAWPILATGPWEGQSSYVVRANPSVLPRAYVVGHAEIMEQDPAKILSRLRTFDPRGAVLLQDDPLADLPASDTERQPFTPADWMSSDPDHLHLKVVTHGPGLLVIADTWMPGWSARVDGTPVEVLRGNHAQRVVPLREAGSHTITLDYTPPGLYLGFAIFLGTLAIWVFLARRIILHSRRDATTPTRGVSGATIPSSASP